MKKLFLLLCILSVALLTGADDKPKADDLTAKLKGAWSLESIEVKGEKVNKENVKIQVLIFDGETVALGRKKDDADKGTYKIDATQKPLALDITMTSGQKKGDTLKLLLQIDGDTLKLAGDKNAKNRPKKFDDEGVAVLTFKREKK